VRLILQGQPDMKIVRAASLLYEYLQRDGVRIFEYCKRPLHGKVALVDDQWATVGSSNLDPLSLALNLEANVVIRDRGFNEELHGRLQKLMCDACQQVTAQELGELKGLAWLRSFVAYHFTRLYPGWAGWLPRHMPRLIPAAKPPDTLEPAFAGAKDKR
jgi:cardiolipin synthase